MTDTDREYLSGEGDPSESQLNQSVYRVRQRITKELPSDMKILKEHRPELFTELQRIVNEERDPPDTLFYLRDILGKIDNALDAEMQGKKGVPQLVQVASDLSRGEYEVSDEEFNEIVNEAIERRIEERTEKSGDDIGEDGGKS